MSEKFSFDDEFHPIPPTAVDADPAATMRDLFYRVARLEQSLEEERVQALADVRGILMELLSLSDDVTDIVEHWGVATKAQEAAVIRGVVGLGRKLLFVLKRYQVEAIDTIGQPFDPETSDLVETEARRNVDPNTVLREVQIGYVWPQGLLRRAKVVVCANPEPDGQSEAGEGSGGKLAGDAES